MLYTLILFMVELSAARFQEPFVLYRSYLWAPGILVALAALLSTLPFRYVLAAFLVTCPLLLYQAQDRLTTFSSTWLLWKDAVAKLPERPVPWGSRTLFNLAREFAHAGQAEMAFSIADRCLAQYPDTFHCYSSRGLIHLQLGEYERALPYLSRAVELNRKSGQARHRLGWNLENLGRLHEAKSLYVEASSLGFGAAKMEVRRLESRLGQPMAGSANDSRDSAISGKRRP
jgi:tetratricopeptide (TPR) repeat protein